MTFKNFIITCLFICLHTKILTTAVDTIRVNTPKIAATIGKTLLFSVKENIYLTIKMHISLKYCSLIGYAKTMPYEKG